MKKNWLDLAEYASLLGLGIGSVASVVSSQFLYASAPLSMLALLNLANRQRLNEESEKRTAIAINALDQKSVQERERLTQQIQDLPTAEILAGLKKSLLIKDREVFTQLSKQISELQAEIQAQLAPLQLPELAELPTDIKQLQTHYIQLNDAVGQMRTRLSHVSGTSQRVESDRTVAQLQAEVSSLRANLQKLADRTKPALIGLQDEINRINQQLRKLPPPFDATALQQEVAEMVRVVSELVPKRDWSSLLVELQLLQQQQESLLEVNETLHHQMQDVQQQMQLRPTKASLHSLQNQVSRVAQQLESLPAPFDPAILKQRLADLVKTVADLVPRQDFSNLLAQVRSLQQQQASHAEVETQLRRELHILQQRLEQAAISGTPLHLEEKSETAEAEDIVPQPPLSVEAAPAEVDDSVPFKDGVHPSDWQNYLSAQLHEALGQLNQRLQTLPTEQDFQPQVEAAFRHELQTLNQQLQKIETTTQYELIYDGATAYSTLDAHPLEGAVSTGPSVLEAALEMVQQHLMLVLPWSIYHHLDGELLNRLEALLQSGCRLDLGWCHIAEPTTPRFLAPISQRWHLQTFQQGKLQDTLRRLLNLKRTYPDLLQFKILGTRESFLVVDSQLAVVGINGALPDLAIFPELGIKLQTTDALVIQQLLTWFEHPLMDETDLVSHWNRAVTYYDLCDRTAALADLERILTVNPDDALAYNFRGVVRYDLGDRRGAIADFTQALEISPRLMIAYCNRGFVHSELGDQLDAIADFNAALRLHNNFAIAYFYRGVACQKFGELSVAISNYSEAIRLAPSAAPPFYYRGMAYAWSNDYLKAIADLERAAHLFDGEGSPTNAEKARAQLEKLWEAVGDQGSASTRSGADLASIVR